ITRNHYASTSPFLPSTDPRESKRNIEKRKGGIIQEAYQWVLKHEGFKGIQRDDRCRLLWIRGDADKGKTMLVCGIIDELLKQPNHYSFSFCQNMDSQSNHAIAVLEGLARGLVQRHPNLSHYFEISHGYPVDQLPEGLSGFRELEGWFANMLRDLILRNCHLVIDALDECIKERLMCVSSVATLNLQKEEGYIDQAIREFVHRKLLPMLLF
ncbi:Vegetative incompatibility protein HET-E-1, partial [Colletotrichum gloeosporioides]